MSDKNEPLPCPFCGEKPEHFKAKSGPWKDFERSFHRCKVMGYIEVSDWTEKVDFTRWNTRVKTNNNEE